MVAVTFEVVSLRTNTLSESVFSLLKTFLELECSSDWSSHVPDCRQCRPFKAVFSFRNSQKSQRPNLANMVDDLILLSVLAKNSRTASASWTRVLSWCEIQAWGQSSGRLRRTAHVTLPIFSNNNASSLFDLVQENQNEQFSSVRWVFGLSVLSSSFTSFRHSLNLLCHSNTLDVFIASAP
jgi:hypothetical protein